MFLLILFLLHQPFLVDGESQTYTIRRDHSLSKTDKLQLPNSWCQDVDVCKRFRASLVSRPQQTYKCSCSCSLPGTATFGVQNSSWQCVDNKKIRVNELHDCKTVRFMNESDSDPLQIFKVQGSGTLNVSSKIHCSENSARISYQACNGGWTPLSKSAAWGLQVTKLWSSSVYTYMLQVNKVNKSQDLQGKVVKLVIPCNTTEFCLLFKVAGNMECLISHLKPLTTTTTTTISTTTIKTTTHPLAETMIITSQSAVTKTNLSQAITTVSTYKAKLWTTHPTVTNSVIGVIREFSHDVPVALIAGSVGSAVVVLVVVVVIGLLLCRKRNRRLSKKTTTKTTETTDQYPVETEVTEAYQSLAPLQDGSTERGLYVAQYKVPNKTNVSMDLCQPDIHPGFDPPSPEKEEKPEYDYAETRVLRSNVLKFLELREEVPKVPENNAPYYHVLEVIEGDAKKEQKEEASEMPEENTHVLERPNGLDSQDNFHKRANEVARIDPSAIFEEPISIDPKSDNEKRPTGEAPATGAYYHVLERESSASDCQADCGYKELQSDGPLYSGYQPLHKYTYVDSGKIQCRKTT